MILVSTTFWISWRRFKKWWSGVLSIQIRLILWCLPCQRPRKVIIWRWWRSSISNILLSISRGFQKYIRFTLTLCLISFLICLNVKTLNIYPTFPYLVMIIDLLRNRIQVQSWSWLDTRIIIFHNCIVCFEDSLHFINV